MNASLRLLAFVAVSLASAHAIAGPTKDQCVDADDQAQALRADGRLREAREHLLTCVAKACPGPVREDCTERLAELDKAAPSIVFELKGANGNDLSAVTVEMDGTTLVTSLDGSALAVDPGEHVFRFTSNGVPAIERKLVVREGEKARHERVVPGEAPSATPAQEPAPHDARDPGSTQRTLGLVAGGVGIAGLAVGSILGLVANSTYKDALNNHCPSGPTSCDPQGVSGGTSAHTDASISTIALVAGGALLAGGAALYFTAPKAGVAVAPAVGMNGAGLSVTGAW